MVLCEKEEEKKNTEELIVSVGDCHKRGLNIDLYALCIVCKKGGSTDKHDGCNKTDSSSTSPCQHSSNMSNKIT